MLAKELREKLNKKLEKESFHSIFKWFMLKRKINNANNKRLDFCQWDKDIKEETNKYIYKKLEEEGFVYKNRGNWIWIEW